MKLRVGGRPWRRIVRADLLAAVTSGQTAACVEALREVPSVFNCQIAHASRAVECAVAPQSVAGAFADAAAAVVAQTGGQRLGRQKRVGGDYLSQKEIAAYAGRDDESVAATESYAGAERPVALMDRSCVDADAGFGAPSPGYLISYGRQDAAHDVVIVVAVGILRYAWRVGQLLFGVPVGYGAGDHSPSAGQQKPRVGADVGIALQIVHTGMKRSFKPR